MCVAKELTRRVTIKDVAAEAGVSVAAVSKVIRDAYGVSDAMKARVQAAVDSLGYRPNVPARTLRGKSFTVGVKATELSSLFVAEVIESIRVELSTTRYEMLVAVPGNDPRDPSSDQRSVESLLDRRVDGLVLIAPWMPTSWLEQIARTTPTVAIAQHGLASEYDTIVDDDEEGARLAVEHLVSLGHQHIVHTSQPAGKDPKRPLSHVARRAGYEAAMRSCRLQPDVLVTSYAELGGYEAAKEALARAERPTAFFAGADVAAMGVIRAVEEAGLRIPKDVSIVGYDNIWVSSIGRVSLTTIDQSSHETGAASARLLLERMEGKRTGPVRYTIAPKLIVRGTTGPAPT
jgi:LacI family transcriptional regulator